MLSKLNFLFFLVTVEVSKITCWCPNLFSNCMNKKVKILQWNLRGIYNFWFFWCTERLVVAFLADVKMLLNNQSSLVQRFIGESWTPFIKCFVGRPENRHRFFILYIHIVHFRHAWNKHVIFFLYDKFKYTLKCRVKSSHSTFIVMLQAQRKLNEKEKRN